MKKLLALLLVFCFAAVANAGISLYIPAGAPGSDPGAPMDFSDETRIFIVSDLAAGVIGSLDVTVTVSPSATVVGATGLADLGTPAVPPGTPGWDVGTWGAECVDYTAGANPLVVAGGWQPDLSFNPILTPQSATVGLGHFGSTIYPTTYEVQAYQTPTNPPYGPWFNGPLAYVDLHCEGPGNVTVTLAPSTQFGGTLDDNGQPIDPGLIGGEIILYQIPEPMTMTLLGLGGLALLRRRR
jgi:hypothetical protein